MSRPIFHVEWDANKARSHLVKHGVAFEAAATVLHDALALTVCDEAHSASRTAGSPSDALPVASCR